MAFVSTWSILNGSTIVIPISDNNTCTVIWNAGEPPETFTNTIPSHTYTVNNADIQGLDRVIVTVTITGQLNNWSFNNSPESAGYLVSIVSYGPLTLADNGSQFKDCVILESLPTSGPLLALPPICRYMFQSCSLLVSGLETLDTSNVLDAGYMFYRCFQFNGNISDWNVSKVTTMDHMFHLCTAFNRDLSSWDVSRVTNMSFMFYGCSAFNGNVSTWNVSNVTDMSRMFSSCTGFNGNISSWNVSKVTNMESMFFSCNIFLQDLSSWNVSSISANAKAPSFTAKYISIVKPRFSSSNPTAWTFNAPVTADVINVIIPLASRDLYYMDGLRLMSLIPPPEPPAPPEPNRPAISKINGAVSSSIKVSYNSKIMSFI